MPLPYDPASKESILNYAQKLLGKSLRDLYPDAEEYSTGKGRMGQTVEKLHFKYKPNSDANPDFDQAGLELKCTPLKENTDGSMVSKERLVLNIIDYVSEGKATFETSSFWHKNQWLLLMFYMHKNGVNVIDLIFKIIRNWNYPDIDRKIIQDDWNKLHWKMTHGLAHEISEGDTLYLGACPKGSKSGAEMRAQLLPNAPKAQQRAYSIKSKYLNTIILDSLLHADMCDNVYLSPAQKKTIRKTIDEAANIVNDISEYQVNETFEQLIERKFSAYYGKTIYDIERMTHVKISQSPKAMSNAVIHAILGVKSPKIREFEKANLQQKSIRLEPNGKLVESMVFDQIKYKEVVEEKVWEESVWYYTLTQRFLFVVFRKAESKKKGVKTDDKKNILEKVFFWTMPRKDLEVAKEFWQDIKDKINKDEFEDFWKLSNHRICHVRPKAKDSSDKMETPSGKMVTKKGYWLNAEYILDIVNAHLQPEETTIEEEKPKFISQYEYDQLKDTYGYIPVYSVDGACGYFGNEQSVEREGWLNVLGNGFKPNAQTQFVVHAVGDSMLPKIQDGDLCVFEWYNGDLRNGDIVLTECNEYDYEYGGGYTIKSYYEFGRRGDLFNKFSVELRPLNDEFEPIVLSEEDKYNYRIIGVLKKVIE